MDNEAAIHHSLMRRGLTVNAMLSLVSGVVLLVGAPVVGDALGLSIDSWLRVFGVALIGHALILAWVRQLDDPSSWTWLNLAMIAPYPLLMIGLATAVIEPGGGKVLLLADGALVGATALMQYFGLRRNGHGLPVRRATA